MKYLITVGAGFITVVTQGQPGETYNIGGHNELRNIDVVHMICDLLEELALNKPPGVNRYTDLITFVSDLSEFSDRHTGLYHLSASGETSWYDFTQAILRLDPKSAEHRVQRVIAIPTEQYPTPAQRPANSLLDNSKLIQNFGLALPHWHKSLELAFE